MSQNDVHKQISDKGLTFFGHMTATFTHDIKNILAIIHENAGLLDDLLLMVNQGLPLSHERVGLISGKISKQVERADDLIKSMNTFAHTHDQVMKQCDLVELVTIVLELTRRIQAKHSATVEFNHKDQRISVLTAPFFFLNLFWLCLEFVIKNKAQSPVIVSCTIDPETNRVIFTFSRLNHQQTADGMLFPPETTLPLRNFLNATLDFIEGEETLFLSLPLSLEHKI